MFAQGSYFKPAAGYMVVDQKIVIEPEMKVSLVADPTAGRSEGKPAIRPPYGALSYLFSEFRNLVDGSLQLAAGTRSYDRESLGPGEVSGTVKKNKPRKMTKSGRYL
tara:strand:- start:4 stop:324 length:321 start_codon:yes stop_codon:yes gene_type:complete